MAKLVRIAMFVDSSMFGSHNLRKFVLISIGWEMRGDAIISEFRCSREVVDAFHMSYIRCSNPL